ncbi:MAG: integrase [Desulfuromonadales bacterium C00003107]|nr:MAG: integrase [Desulfuromonadales bacterium C00003107]
MAKTFSKLNRSCMRKLKPGEEIREHGITFVRLVCGDGRFTVSIMVDGQRIHRMIGRESDGTTRTQAVEFIAKVRRDAREDRLALPKRRKVALSFKAAGEKYIEKLAEEGGKDIKAKRRRLHQHLIPFFGNTPLSKISTFDIERYKQKRSRTKAIPGGEKRKPKDASKLKLVGKGTINRELAVLSHLFTKAEEWGWVSSRPAKIKRFPEPPGRAIYLTAEQARTVTDCARRDQNYQTYPFFVIGLETAMRKMEILSIRREHVDLQRLEIYIPDAKGGVREQPITKHLAEFLMGYMETLPLTPWLFPSERSKSGHAVDIRKAFRRVVSAAGLNPDEVVRHTLRHTAITHLIQAGVDLPTVKRISGHKTLVMIERYAHQNGAHIQEAMDKLENRLQIGE